MNQEHDVISVSGGKDSTALLLLAIERQPDNLQAVFADTGNEHPQTYDYVRYLADKTGVAIRWVRADFTDRIAGKAAFIRAHWMERLTKDGMSQAEAQSRIDRALAILDKGPTGSPFLDLCIWKGRFPSRKAQFCTQELKREPIIEQVQMPLLDQGDRVVSWQGVRADESPNRALLKERECVGTFPDTGGELWNYRPILQWKASECFDMHRRHGVEPNPLYMQGMSRVGCMPCINSRKDEVLEISKRFPAEFERIAEWERIVSDASKRGASSFFHASEGSVLHGRNNIAAVVEWSKTSRGGRHIDLLRAHNDNEFGPICTSVYGLCE